MDKTSVGIEFSEYDFLCLLLAAKRLNNDSVLVNFTKLARDLFPYSQNEEYKSLFIDVCAKNKIDDQFVEIKTAIWEAVVAGIIEITPDGSDETVGINMVLEDEAEALIHEAGDERASLMKRIVQELKAKKETKKPYTMHPIKHNEESNK